MDERLKGFSDKIRKGIPVDLREALEVIDYQGELLKKKAEQGIFRRLWNKIKGNLIV